MKRALVALLCVCLVTPAGATWTGGKHRGAAAPTTVISDNFATNTAANYVAWGAGVGGVTVSSGVAHGQTSGGPNIAVHSTTIGSANQTVTLKASVVNATDYADIILRAASATGTYPDLMVVTWIPGGNPSLISTTGGSPTTVGSFTGCTLAAGAWTHLVKASVSGSTYHAWIDLNDDLDYADAGEDCGTLTSSTNATGQYAGVGLDRTGAADPTIDDFTVTTP